jgi:hypothetical protein
MIKIYQHDKVAYLTIYLLGTIPSDNQTAYCRDTNSSRRKFAFLCQHWGRNRTKIDMSYKLYNILLQYYAWRKLRHVIVNLYVWGCLHLPIQIFIFSALTRSQELFEPLYRILGVPLQLVLVIHKVETKPWSVTSCPLPIIQKRPYKIPFHIATIFSAITKTIDY